MDFWLHYGFVSANDLGEYFYYVTNKYYFNFSFVQILIFHCPNTIRDVVIIFLFMLEYLVCEETSQSEPEWFDIGFHLGNLSQQRTGSCMYVGSMLSKCMWMVRKYIGKGYGAISRSIIVKFFIVEFLLWKYDFIL